MCVGGWGGGGGGGGGGEALPVSTNNMTVFLCRNKKNYCLI